MSADNWGTCPRCLLKRKEEKKKAFEYAASIYGQVPYEEYLEAYSLAKNMSDVIDDSLREDWDIGINDSGEFLASYTASCQDCGFEFKFRHEVVVDEDR